MKIWSWPTVRLRAALVVVAAAVGLAMLFPGIVFASYSTTQLAYDDDLYQTNSVKIVCNANAFPPCSNQNGGSNFSQCLPTPNTFTHDYNWWYQGQVALYLYTSTGCSGTSFTSTSFTAPVGDANPWYCYDYPHQGPFQC